MGNVVVGTSRWGDNATIDSVSSEETNAPSSELQTMYLSDIWQTTSASSQFVIFDRGEAKLMTFFALWAHNGTSSGTWRVRTADTEANLTSAPDHDSGSLSLLASPGINQWFRKHAMYHVPAGVTNRWCRIDIDDPTNPDGFFVCGRVTIDPAHQFTYPHQFGANEWVVQDNSQSAITENGTEVFESKPIGIGTRLTFQTFDSDGGTEMRTAFFELNRVRGTSRDIFVVLDPEDGDGYRGQRMIYGTLRGVGPLHRNFGLYEFDVAIRGQVVPETATTPAGATSTFTLPATLPANL